MTENGRDANTGGVIEPIPHLADRVGLTSKVEFGAQALCELRENVA
jgi:hypothetical protein